MTWLFSKALMDQYANSLSSQELEAEFLEENSLDGRRFARLNVIPSVRPFWRNDKTTDAFHLSRFGLTQKRLTEHCGEVLLTWFRVVFLVRISRLPVPVRGLMDQDPACGGMEQESFAKLDQVSSSWKTRQCSLLGGLVEYLETWPKWGSMRNGAASRRQTPSGIRELRALITKGKESGLSDTAPTPTVHGNNNRKGVSPKSGDGLATFVRTVPTPLKSDWRSGKCSPATMEKNSRPLREVIGGSLNPDWVEWLMGLPIGWSALAALEMHKFRQWFSSHGST